MKPPENPKNEKRVGCDLVDKAYENEKVLKSVGKEQDKLKKDIRENAFQNGLTPGSLFTLFGKKHECKVFCPHDSVSFKEDCDFQAITRVKALAGDAVDISRKLVLKDEKKRELKEILGSNFELFFEEEIQSKINSEKLDEWKQKRMASANLNEAVNFVEEHITRKTQTPRVSF